MANTLRIKRSAGSTAPTTLANAELAYAEGSDVLYIGVGTSGSNAASVYQIASGSLFTSKTANYVYAAPNGSNGAPTWRALVAADIASGTLDIGRIPTGTSGTTVALGNHTHGNITSAGAIGSTASLPIITTTSGVLTTGAFGTGGGQFCQGNDIRLVGDGDKGDITVSASNTVWTIDNNAVTYAKIQNVSATDRLLGRATAGAGVIEEITCTAFARSILDDADGAAVRTTIGAGTVTSVALSLPSIFTVSGSPVTSSGTLTGALASQTANHVFAAPNATNGAPTFRALVAADIPTLTAAKISDFDTQVRTNRLDQMAAPTAAVAFNSQRITNLATPVAGSDAATKIYVDSVVNGLDVKASVRAATTANITLSGTQTIDGVALVSGDRVLVKNQTNNAQNGIYLVSVNSWVRAEDFDAWTEFPGAFFFVEEGTTNGDNGFVCTADAGGTLGTTAVTFAQFSGAGQITDGSGLSKTGNTLNVVAGTGISVANDDVALTGQALALHNVSTVGIIIRNSPGQILTRSIATSGNGITVNDGTGSSGNPTLSLSTALSTVGGLIPAADRLPYYASASTAALATFTSFGRSLVDDADASAGRTTLGLGTIATQNENNVTITGGSIDNITIDGGSWS